MKHFILFLLSILFLTLVTGCTGASAPAATATLAPIVTQAPPTSVPPSPVQPTATKEAYPERLPEWTFKTGGPIASSPVVSDGVVFFGSDDHFLYAVDVTTHELKWKYETGNVIISRPEVTQDVVYFTSYDGYVYAVTTSAGQLVWKTKVDQGSIPEFTRLNEAGIYQVDMQSSPTVLEDTLYVGSSDGVLYAIDIQTGKEKWRFANSSKFSIRSIPLVANGTVYFGDLNGDFYAINAQTGLQVWHVHLDAGVHSTPVISNETIYFGGRAGYFHALDAKTGQEKWRFELGPKHVGDGFYMLFDANSSVVDDVIYTVGSNWTESALFAINCTTGAEKWEFEISGFELLTSKPVVDKNTVYTGAFQGRFYAVDINTGLPKWYVKVSSKVADYGILSWPVVVDGIVYFGGLDGNLYAVKAAD